MAFTRDWDESDPIDHSKNSTWPAEIREVMVDVSDRLSSIVSGFTSGESTEGIKKLPFIAQGSDPGAVTDQIQIYGKAVSGKTELHFQDEDGNVVQWTTAGALKLPTTTLINLIYPVGSIYTSVVSTNPGTLFGVGTWAAFAAGRVLVGIDAGQTEFDTVEETGGAKTHTLTAAESGLPAHTHGIHNSNGGGGGGGDLTNLQKTDNTNLGGINTDANSSASASQAHNNLQPYIVVYMWKRTA